MNLFAALDSSFEPQVELRRMAGDASHRERSRDAVDDEVEAAVEVAEVFETAG